MWIDPTKEHESLKNGEDVVIMCIRDIFKGRTKNRAFSVYYTYDYQIATYYAEYVPSIFTEEEWEGAGFYCMNSPFGICKYDESYIIRYMPFEKPEINVDDRIDWYYNFLRGVKC